MTTATRNDILTVASALVASAIKAQKDGDTNRSSALLGQAAEHYRAAGNTAWAKWCEQRIG